MNVRPGADAGRRNRGRRAPHARASTRTRRTHAATGSGETPYGRQSLKRISRASIAGAAVAAATATGIALAQDTPAAPPADPATLQSQNDQLRQQLRAERRTHARSLRKARKSRLALVRRYSHQLRSSPNVRNALKVAAATYGVPESRLTRIATCESTLVPSAQHGPYVDLFQFGTPLWNATPYREFSRSDPYASALAASWAFSKGMDRHWPVCSRR